MGVSDRHVARKVAPHTLHQVVVGESGHQDFPGLRVPFLAQNKRPRVDRTAAQVLTCHLESQLTLHTLPTATQRNKERLLRITADL